MFNTHRARKAANLKQMSAVSFVSITLCSVVKKVPEKEPKVPRSSKGTPCLTANCSVRSQITFTACVLQSELTVLWNKARDEEAKSHFHSHFGSITLAKSPEKQSIASHCRVCPIQLGVKAEFSREKDEFGCVWRTALIFACISLVVMPRRQTLRTLRSLCRPCLLVQVSID